jgi:lysyl-tRNA synthetase class 2
MLEFYQAYADYRDLMDLTEQMFPQAARDVTGSTRVTYQGEEIEFAKWQRLSMREAIIKYWPEIAGAKPEMSDFASADSVGRLVQRFNAAHAHMPYDPDAPAGKTIAALFGAVAEPHLLQPTIIYDFPLAISPLSKNKRDEPDWVERFEVFIGRLELGNAFSELNDPEEQRRRFEMQLAQKARGDQEAHPMDEDYIRALSYGLPPTAGYGVGIDRLTMLLTDSKSIRDVILFPLLRPQAKTAEDAEDAASS